MKIVRNVALALVAITGACAVPFACTPQTASNAEPSVSFHFTYEAFSEQPDAAAVTAQWTARCVTGGEFADVASNYAPDPRMTADERRAQAAKFDRAAFVRIATDTWRKANAALPQKSVLFCVDLAPSADAFTRDAMGGVSAVTAGQGRIILRIHPEADWQAVLSYTLAHELHHSYWAQHHFAPANPFTLADYLAFEGRADYFAGSLFAHRAPWTAALDDAAYAAAWSRISGDLNKTDWATLEASMFGAPQAGIPMWAGYSIGYRLVSERMARAPKLDLKAMTAAPAAEFMPSTSR